MRVLRWVSGIAIVGAAGIALLLTDASAGDVIVELEDPAVQLTGPQVAGVRSLAQSLWTDIQIANVRSFRCERQSGAVMCDAQEIRTLAAVDAVALEMDDTKSVRILRRQISDDGATVVADVRHPAVDLDAAAKQSLATQAAAIFGTPAATIIGMRVWRTDGAVYGSVLRLTQVSPQERMLCLRASTCGRIIAEVE